MTNEKHKSDKGLGHCIKYGSKPKEHTTLSPHSLDYLKKIQTGKPDFDVYLGFILLNKEKSETSGPKRAVGGDNKRIDSFLRKHSGLSYQDFVEQSKPEKINRNSYGLLKRGAIRRSLFESRSRLYLLALCDYEEQCGDIGKVLEDIRLRYVPIVKKTRGTEPTFDAIYLVLKR